jgi:hypothetical protein
MFPETATGTEVGTRPMAKPTTRSDFDLVEMLVRIDRPPEPEGFAVQLGRLLQSARHVFGLSTEVDNLVVLTTISAALRDVDGDLRRLHERVTCEQ